MSNIFLTVLNMSLTGAFVIIAICIARLPLKKAPKIISYCLWAVAWLRLVIPFSIESVLSLIPFNAATIPTNTSAMATPHINSGIIIVDSTVGRILPSAVPLGDFNPMQVWTIAGISIWLFGILLMLAYGIVSYVILKRKMRSAIQL